MVKESSIEATSMNSLKDVASSLIAAEKTPTLRFLPRPSGFFFNRGYQRVKFERCCFEFDSSRENANVKVFATTEVFCGVFF